MDRTINAAVKLASLKRSALFEGMHIEEPEMYNSLRTAADEAITFSFASKVYRFFVLRMDGSPDFLKGIFDVTIEPIDDDGLSNKQFYLRFAAGDKVHTYIANLSVLPENADALALYSIKGKERSFKAHVTLAESDTDTGYHYIVMLRVLDDVPVPQGSGSA